MRVGELFAGIGGFSLGLERAGMDIAWQVEIDPFCQAVLAKHWPNVPRYGDVCKVQAESLEYVDLLCGGFPCQDVADAGHRQGLAGERSGLWTQFDRLIGALRPRLVLLENSPGLANRGLDRVLANLASRGYDAEWDCIPATTVGATQGRARLYLVAYASPVRRPILGAPYHYNAGNESRDLANGRNAGVGNPFPAGPNSARVSPIPYILRSAPRIPHKSHRIAALGNSVCPQVAEMLGRRILEADIRHNAECDLDDDCLTGCPAYATNIPW